MLEVARGESLMTLGRETSDDVRWPRTTALYKGNRSQRGSSEESAGLIVPLEGWDNTTQPEGRSPTSVTGVQLSLSRLNYRLPGDEANPEVVQGTTYCHHEIANALLP